MATTIHIMVMIDAIEQVPQEDRSAPSEKGPLDQPHADDVGNETHG